MGLPSFAFLIFEMVSSYNINCRKFSVSSSEMSANSYFSGKISLCSLSTSLDILVSSNYKAEIFNLDFEER